MFFRRFQSMSHLRVIVCLTTENGASRLKSSLPSREKSCSASGDVAQPCDVKSSTTAGIRYVRPWYFEFISHVKNRWAGNTIVDLFTEEFKGWPRDYYAFFLQLLQKMKNLQWRLLAEHS